LSLVSVVVPVYFNEATLPALLERLRAVAPSVPDTDFEFIFVDDGSRDHSFEVLAKEAARDRRVRVLRLSRNFGSNPAILAGLTVSRGDAVAIIAADLQDPPELIPEMVALWRDGGEVVLAARRSREDAWTSKLFATVFNRLYRRFVFPDFPRGGFDFMLLTRRVARLIADLKETNSYINGQVMWLGFERRVLHYDRAQRPAGRSRWTFMKKVKYLVDAFTAFSYLPVRAASLLGFVLALGGFGYAVLLVGLRLTRVVDVPGFAAVMVVLLIVSGTQLIMIGMIGEYLWRVLEASRRRPAFVVASTVNVDESPDDAGPRFR
jgi:dolichol-phosphate mannosyltransferase